MKKLLFLFDTDPYPSVFDTVVGYDGGADRVTGYANVTPENVDALVDGTIFTRGGKDKQNTAIFIGGGNMEKGEALLEAVKKRFFGPFRVSVMLDSNGSNTTAAAGVQEGRGARGHRPGRHARRRLPRPRGRRRDHHLAHQEPRRRCRQGAQEQVRRRR
jgi:hypothetical protein